jgi:hypothetical protein
MMAITINISVNYYCGTYCLTASLIIYGTKTLGFHHKLFKKCKKIQL